MLMRKPNLTPPVATTEMALAYKEKLERLEPNVKFLMTLYLSPQLTVEEVAKAKANGIVGISPHSSSHLSIESKLTLGVKSYPKYFITEALLMIGA
jgi:dihydroorotase